MAKNVNLDVIDFGALDTKVEQRLGFKPDPNLYGGLSLGKILSITLEDTEVSLTNQDGTPSSWEFAGCKLPNIVIEFEQVVGPKDPAKRYITVRESITSTTDKNGTPVEIKLWADLTMNLFKRLQHYVNVFNEGNLAPIDSKMALPKIAFSDAKEKRIADMRKMFAEYVRVLTAKRADGKARFEGITFWMAVIADPKSGTYFRLPDFVGKGYLEVFKQNTPPTIEIPNSASVVLTKKTDKKEPAAKANMNYQDADAVQRGTVSADATADDILKQMGVSM